MYNGYYILPPLIQCWGKKELVGSFLFTACGKMSFSSKISAVEKSRRVVYFKWRLIYPENVSFLSEEGEMVQARACRGSRGWLRPIPQFSSSSLLV